VHLSLVAVHGATINAITISAPSNSPNTDGVDPWSATNVTITGNTIDDGDDDVAINSSPSYGAAHDITVSGNTILHGHGISIGSYTNGSVYNINVHDNTFNSTNIGIRIKSARDRGGAVYNVTYAHLTMTNVPTPILFTEYYPSIPADGDPAQPITSTTPYFHNITVSNLTATGATTAGTIVGLPEQHITAVSFTSVTITAKTGITVRNAALALSNASPTVIHVSAGPAFILQSNATVTTT
jgi:polygalacturonase